MTRPSGEVVRWGAAAAVAAVFSAGAVDAVGLNPVTPEVAEVRSGLTEQVAKGGIRVNYRGPLANQSGEGSLPTPAAPGHQALFPAVLNAPDNWPGEVKPANTQEPPIPTSTPKINPPTPTPDVTVTPEKPRLPILEILDWQQVVTVPGYKPYWQQGKFFDEHDDPGVPYLGSWDTEQGVAMNAVTGDGRYTDTVKLGSAFDSDRPVSDEQRRQIDNPMAKIITVRIPPDHPFYTRAESGQTKHDWHMALAEYVGDNQSFGFDLDLGVVNPGDEIEIRFYGNPGQICGIRITPDSAIAYTAKIAQSEQEAAQKPTAESDHQKHPQLKQADTPQRPDYNVQYQTTKETTLSVSRPNISDRTDELDFQTSIEKANLTAESLAGRTVRMQIIRGENGNNDIYQLLLVNDPTTDPVVVSSLEFDGTFHGWGVEGNGQNYFLTFELTGGQEPAELSILEARSIIHANPNLKPTSLEPIGEENAGIFAQTGVAVITTDYFDNDAITRHGFAQELYNTYDARLDLEGKVDADMLAFRLDHFFADAQRLGLQPSLGLRVTADDFSRMNQATHKKIYIDPKETRQLVDTIDEIAPLETQMVLGIFENGLVKLDPTIRKAYPNADGSTPSSDFATVQSMLRHYRDRYNNLVATAESEAVVPPYGVSLYSGSSVSGDDEERRQGFLNTLALLNQPENGGPISRVFIDYDWGTTPDGLRDLMTGIKALGIEPVPPALLDSSNDVTHSDIGAACQAADCQVIYADPINTVLNDSATVDRGLILDDNDGRVAGYHQANLASFRQGLGR